MTDPRCGIGEAFRRLLPCLTDEALKHKFSAALADEFSSSHEQAAVASLLGCTTCSTNQYPNIAVLPRSACGPRIRGDEPRHDQQSVHRLLARLVGVIVICCPLVLHLEQFHHADATIVKFVEELVSLNRAATGDPKIYGLLILVSCRNDVDLPIHISLFLDRTGVSNADADTETPEQSVTEGRVFTLCLNPLSWENVYAWSVDVLEHTEWTEDGLRVLVDNLYEQSGGIPRYIEFRWQLLRLRAIHQTTDKGFLELRRTTRSSTRDLFVCIYQELPLEVRNALDIVATLEVCTDDTIDTCLLDIVLQQSSVDVCLRAQHFGLLELTDHKIQFTWAEIPMILYSLMQESKRKTIHLMIARKLYRCYTNSDHETKCNNAMLHQIARNWQRGIDLVTDTDERDSVAMTCLNAGRLSMQSSDFSKAAEYFTFAISTLGDRLWKSQWYDLSLALHNFGSEACYSAADYPKMELLLDCIFAHATTLQDKLQAYTTLVYAKGSQHHLQDAITLSLRVLTEIGEPIVSKPTRLTIAHELWRTRWLLSQKSDRFLLNLPAATHVDKIAAIHLLNFTMMYSYLVKPDLGMLAVFRIMQLVVKYGITASALPAIAAYGFLLCTHRGDVKVGRKFGQLALALFEDLNPVEARAWMPRVYHLTHGMIHPWIYPLQQSLEPLHLAYHSGLKTGDIEGSMLAGATYLDLSFNSGRPLPAMEREARSYCLTMESLRQEMGLICMMPLYDILCKLLDEDFIPLKTNTKSMSTHEVYVEAVEAGNEFAARLIYLYQIVYYCFFGQYDCALKLAKQSWRIQTGTNLWLEFFGGLSALAVAHGASGLLRRWNRRIGKRCIKAMKRWATHCPSNGRNKFALLKAELAALDGDVKAALVLYNESIDAAKVQGMVHEEGMSYDRLAQYYSSLGIASSAEHFWKKARESYQHWGAGTLVRKIDDKALFQEDITMPPSH